LHNISLMLRIRLSRVGRRNQAKYRIVVTEHQNPIKGKFFEIIGSYNPEANPKELRLNKDRYDHWVGKGAQPTKTVQALYTKAS